VKRRDPWFRANAPSKAAADPEPMVKTRRKSQACLDLVRRPMAQPSVEASSKASLEIQRPRGAGRPCHEAGNSACRGEWRRESGSPREGERLMPVRERESDELPFPICPRSTERSGGDLLFSGILFAAEIKSHCGNRHGFSISIYARCQGARYGRVSSSLAAGSLTIFSCLTSQCILRPTSMEIKPRWPGMAEWCPVCTGVIVG
jgi:hypothetical protein